MEGHEPAVLIIKTTDEEVTLDNVMSIGINLIRSVHDNQLMCTSKIFLISQVFGAFLSTDMIERRKHDSNGFTYFGTGECFVFTVRHIPVFFVLYSTSAQYT